MTLVAQVLRDAPDYIRNNRNIVIAAVNNDAYSLQYASPDLQNDKQVVMAAVQTDYLGIALKFASPELQNDKQVVMAAVQNNGDAIQFASPDLRNDKQFVIAAFKENGKAIKYVSLSLQNDKQVVMAAMKKNPNNIIYVHEDLKRDPDVLIASGMYDKDHVNATVRIQQQQQQRQQQQSTGTYKRKIVLSTRFSLNRTSQSDATMFTAFFKQSRYIQKDFIVYAPNAFDKKTCDPEWTRLDWPCRGTEDTCQYNNILTTEGHPTDDCCWRYSFRSQLQEAKDTGGFMLQLVETCEEDGMVKDATLGMGQTIELDMANTVNLKVFQAYHPEDYDGREWCFEDQHIDYVTAEISRWYDDGCQDMSVETILQGRDSAYYRFDSSVYSSEDDEDPDYDEYDDCASSEDDDST